MKLFLREQIPLGRRLSLSRQRRRSRRHGRRAIGAGFMRLEDRLVLSVAALGGALPDETIASVDAQVAAEVQFVEPPISIEVRLAVEVGHVAATQPQPEPQLPIVPPPSSVQALVAVESSLTAPTASSSNSTSATVLVTNNTPPQSDTPRPDPPQGDSPQPDEPPYEQPQPDGHQDDEPQGEQRPGDKITVGVPPKISLPSVELPGVVELPTLPVNVRGPIWNPVEAVVESVPIVGGDDQVDDPASILDRDGSGDGDASQPDVPVPDAPVPDAPAPDSSVPELPTLPPGAGEDQPPEDDGQGSTTGGESPSNNDSAGSNDSGAQQPSVDGGGEFDARLGSGGLTAQRNIDAVDQAFAAEAVPTLLANNTIENSDEQTLAANAVLDAALAELAEAEVTDQEIEAEESAEVQAELVAETAEQTSPEEAGENEFSAVAIDLTSLLEVVGSLAPGLVPALSRAVIEASAVEISLALEALDNLLEAMGELRDVSGLLTQVCFAICLLSTVAAAGTGCEITRRKLKRDRVRAGTEDDSLPPDMLATTSLS